MRHPTEGVLRRLLDEPAGVSDADRTHLADCPQCRTALAVVRDDAATVETALAHHVTDVDVDAAWRRLSTDTGGPRPLVATAPPRRSRFRAIVRQPAFAAFAAVAVLAGAGTAAANDWLEIFRTEKVTPISIKTGDLVSMPDLSAYGELAVIGGRAGVHEVPDAAAATKASGLAVPEVRSLPDGVTGAPVYQVGDKTTATFTFSAARAAQAATEAGETLPPPPAGVDGARVRLEAGPGVAQIWRSSSGVPALLVGRAIAPTAFSSGVPFETLRDYVLSLPGLPDDVAAQLRTFTADGSTLPLPVPTDRATTSSAEVNGQPATVLTARDKSMAAVVWVKDGLVTVVAGSLDRDEVLSVARELR